MKTITYNEQTHRLVPVEPTEEMFEQMVAALCVADGYKKAVLVAPQPEPVESEGTELNLVEPVGYVISGGKFNGRLLQPYEYELNVHPELERWKVCCRPLYTAPPDYEEIKRQRDELAAVFQLIIAEMEQRDRNDGNAPGHRHNIPGMWDSDNGKLSGKPCAWCAVWKKAKELCATTASVKGGV